MPLIKASGSLRFGNDKIVFILDASESAQNVKENIINLMYEILKQLPHSSVEQIYFLGNPSHYDPSMFTSRATSWFKQNSSRASLITPIFHILRNREDVQIVTIGSGPIFDLADWENDPILQRTLFVCLGESLTQGVEGADEIKSPSPTDLINHFYLLPTCAEIKGKGFLPLLWSNPSYRLSISRNGEATLKAENTTDFSLKLVFLITEGSEPQVTLTYSGGIQKSIALDQIELCWESPTPILLTTSEKEIFNKALRRESFLCLHCGKEHSYDTLRCRAKGGIYGDCIYPTLAKEGISGFVIFFIEGDKVFSIPYQSEVFPLGNMKAAIRKGPITKIYAYDETNGGWFEENQQLPPYYLIEEGKYVVVF